MGNHPDKHHRYRAPRRPRDPPAAQRGVCPAGTHVRRSGSAWGAEPVSCPVFLDWIRHLVNALSLSLSLSLTFVCLLLSICRSAHYGRREILSTGKKKQQPLDVGLYKEGFFCSQFREIYFGGVWDSDLRSEASSGSGRHTGMIRSEEKKRKTRYSHTTETSRDGDIQMRWLTSLWRLAMHASAGVPHWSYPPLICV